MLVTVGDFSAALAALAAVGTGRVPVDLARTLGRVGSEEAGHLFALTVDGARAGASPWDMAAARSVSADGVASLPVRGRGAIEAGTVGAGARWAAARPVSNPSQCAPASRWGRCWWLSTRSGLDLVPGAPVVDDADLLFGVVAPRCLVDGAGCGPVGPARPTRSQTAGAGRPATSGELLIVDQWDGVHRRVDCQSRRDVPYPRAA